MTNKIRYYYLPVDEIITTHTEALQILSCAPGDVSSATER